MKRWIAAIAGFALLGCGAKEEPKQAEANPRPVLPKPKEPAKDAPKSDPDGTFACVNCNVKLKDTKCRYCGAVLKNSSERTSSGGGGGAVSTLSPTYVCPKEGCRFTSGRKEKCLSHPDTDLREQWFVCACGEKDVKEGRCPKCDKALARQLN